MHDYVAGGLVVKILDCEPRGAAGAPFVESAPKKECDAEVFQAIFSASIREDLPAVRTAAVEVAKTSATIRSMYDKHDLQESIHKRFPGGYTKGRRSKIGSRWS